MPSSLRLAVESVSSESEGAPAPSDNMASIAACSFDGKTTFSTSRLVTAGVVVMLASEGFVVVEVMVAAMGDPAEETLLLQFG